MPVEVGPIAHSSVVEAMELHENTITSTSYSIPNGRDNQQSPAIETFWYVRFYVNRTRARHVNMFSERKLRRSKMPLATQKSAILVLEHVHKTRFFNINQQTAVDWC